MESYEAKRMQASIDAWKQRFPLLYQGGQYEVEDLARNQAGELSPNVRSAIQASGLEAPVEGDQYKQAVDLGLNPITLSQRTSQAVTRQLAMNPEWTKKISGGTLATMVANDYQNQNAFNAFLGANQTAQYVAGQTASASNTAALLTGLTGSAAIGFRAYQNANPLDLGTYYQGNIYQGGGGSFGGAGAGSSWAPSPPPAYSGNPYGNSMWGATASYNTYGGSAYGNTWDFSNPNMNTLFTPIPSSTDVYLGIPGGP